MKLKNFVVGKLALTLLLLSTVPALSQTKAQIAERKNFAAALENKLLANGLDVEVAASGSILRISGVSSRPLVYQMLHAVWLQQALPLGFRYLVITPDERTQAGWGFHWNGTTWQTWEAPEPDRSYAQTRDSVQWDGMNQR